MKTPFDILNVADSADDASVKSAYLKKTREFPPDRAPEKFKEIKEAYEKIKSLENRVEYKLFLREQPDSENLTSALALHNHERIQPENLIDLIVESAKVSLKRQI